MRIVNILTCYNEIEYIPYTIAYYKKIGIDVFVLDNYSTDGSYEWLIDHKIPVERVDTEGAFHLERLQKARIKKMHELKPDWVIYGDADEFIVTVSTPLREIIALADQKGFNELVCRKFEFYNTGEGRPKGNPKNTYYYYANPFGEKGGIARIHKYDFQVTYDMDFFVFKEEKPCVIEAFVLNYGTTKSKEQREDVFKRRQKAWDKGLPKLIGSHYLKQRARDWIWDKEALLDVRNFEPLRRFINEK